MKNVNRNFKKNFSLLLFIGILFHANASEKIVGNGTIKTTKKALPDFHKIEIGTYCNVDVNAGGMPMYELKIDDNLLKHLQLKVEDGILKVTTHKWLEATVIQLTISVPFITSFSNSGWGKIKIRDLETQSFQLFGKTGNFYLEGKVEELNITAGTGNINALKMDAKRVIINKTSHGKVRVNATERLTLNGNTDNVSYLGSPKVFKNGIEKVITEKDLKSKRKIEYVSINIKNNSLTNMAFVIRGPKERKFSYGFSLFPFSTKKEKVPVGTMFFDETLNGEKLLITVTKDDDGKTINLFK